MTTGALRLSRSELDALGMFQVAAFASRAFAYATSAADLVLLGEWCTRLLWSAAGFVVLSTVVGVPIDVAAAYVVGIVVVVAVTRPLLLLTDRGLVKLIDDTAELVDLETVRHSAQPASLACLLLALLEDQNQAKSRWEIAHLWFERDVVDFDSPNGFGRLVGQFAPAEVGTPACPRAGVLVVFSTPFWALKTIKTSRLFRSVRLRPMERIRGRRSAHAPNRRAVRRGGRLDAPT